MPDPSRAAFEDWKSAEAAAREAERQLAAAWESYELTRGAPPTRELMEEVSRRRAIANDRLTLAMKLLDVKAGR